MRARVSRKWYLVVIVLLYVGLLASFSLNVTLLMRKPVNVRIPEMDKDYGKTELDWTGSSHPTINSNKKNLRCSGNFPEPTASTVEMKRSTEKTSQLGFAYTTPCLVTGKERKEVSEWQTVCFSAL